MKNYYWSILVHMAVFLLILFSWKTVPAPPKEEAFAITIDFRENIIVPSDLNQKKSTPPNPTVQKNTPPPSINKKKPSKTKPSPATPSPTSTPISQKSKESKVEAVATTNAEEEAALLAAQQLEEEKNQKEKEKNEKVSFFTNLLNKSKEITDSNNEAEKVKSKENSNTKSSESRSLPAGKDSNIQGFAGSRKVIKIPVINDNSQKQGRVVVNICVNQHGKVISSKYTQIGSTTADTYLIELAEKGASGYLFSPSTQSKECGRVIIEFRLRA